MKETLIKLRKELRPVYGQRETEAIIRIMFHFLKGWNTVDILMHENEPLSDFILHEIDSILKRLLKHEPIQYITGKARFHGMEFKVTPDVLIPRPETDELTDLIIDDCADKEDLDILDIATGSGCIAISLARNIPFSNVTALDISAKALDVARLNAENLKANVKFIHADIFNWQPSDNSFDIIVSNPPYIDMSEKEGMEPNVLDHEPASALFVPDSDPLVFYKRISSLASNALRPGGTLYFEINPRHANGFYPLLSSHGFQNVEILKDFQGRHRMVKACKPVES